MKHLSYTLLGGAGLLALTGCGSAQETAEQTQPNVIYVFPDQFRNMAMGFWGEPGFKEHVRFVNDPVHTPNIDKFAKESLVLSSAMSNCPLSSPHRGSLLTGMYPNKSGIPLNCNSDRPISSLRTDVECVSDVFSKNGYDCAYFGKLHADFPTPNDPANPGHYVEDKTPAWDAYTPKERRHGFNYWYSYGTFDEHKNPHYWDTEGKRHDPKEWSPLHEAKQVVSYLKNENGQRDANKPFFIMVGMNPPHSPYRSLDDCMEEDFNLYKDMPTDSLLIRPNARGPCVRPDSGLLEGTGTRQEHNCGIRFRPRRNHVQPVYRRPEELAVCRIHEPPVHRSLSGTYPPACRQPAAIFAGHHADTARTLQTG